MIIWHIIGWVTSYIHTLVKWLVPFVLVKNLYVIIYGWTGSCKVLVSFLLRHRKLLIFYLFSLNGCKFLLRWNNFIFILLGRTSIWTQAIVISRVPILNFLNTWLKLQISTKRFISGRISTNKLACL